MATSSETQIAVEVNGLTKKYDDFLAVDGLSFKIRKGEIFGLLGPNGAGKSTTMKMMVGLTSITAGSIKVFNKEIKTFFDAREYMTIVPQEPLIWDVLTVKENVKYIIDIYDLDPKRAEEMMRDFLEKLNLSDFENRLAKNLSGGMKQKLSLLMSIITERPVLILDEPTTGLDPIARKEMWDYIMSLKSKGITIILSTHYMEEADYLCDNIAIIDQGRIVALGTPDDLKEKYGGNESITFYIKSGCVESFEDLKQKFPDCNFAFIEHEKMLIVSTDNAFDILSHLVELISAKGIEIDKVSVSKSTLNDVFINLTGRKLSNE